MTFYAKNFNKSMQPPVTPQSAPLPERETEMVKMRSGGYAFLIDPIKQFERFLILGSEKNTYYATKEQLSLENAQGVLALIGAGRAVECIQLIEAVNTSSVVSDGDEDIYRAVRAPKKAPSIFALAMIKIFGSNEDRKMVYDVIRRKAVISTLRQMYEFLHDIYYLTDGKITFSSGFKTALADWFGTNDRWIAMQFAKYRNSSRGKHTIDVRDILRMARPTAHGTNQNVIFNWAVKRASLNYGQRMDLLTTPETSNSLSYIQAFETAQETNDPKVIYNLIAEHGLTHEMIPNTWFSDEHKQIRVNIWRLLLGLDTANVKVKRNADGTPMWKMGLTAMIRNLTRVASYGILNEVGTKDVADAFVNVLNDTEALVKARIHPLQLLSAMRMYQKGHNDRTEKSWRTNNSVLKALENAFYASFGTIGKTGKTIGYFLDISGSMEAGEVIGLPGVTPREAGAVLTMVSARNESDWLIRGFNTRLVEIDINPTMSLDQVVKVMSNLDWGGTDASQPMTWAMKENINLDAFILITDNESWHGDIHVTTALANYRRKVNPNAKLVVISMTATNSSIADPKDVNQLELVGFDSAAPQIIADFISG